MKALCWHGKEVVRVDTVPDSVPEAPRDAIFRVTATAICGSDLHLYGGLVPTLESGDILGHEFMGEVVETGSAVAGLKKGDRVVVPFAIACAECFFCSKHLYSLCDTIDPGRGLAIEAMGHATCGMFGQGHMTGGRGPDSCVDAVGAEAHGHGTANANALAATARDLANICRSPKRRVAMTCSRNTRMAA